MTSWVYFLLMVKFDNIFDLLYYSSIRSNTLLPLIIAHMEKMSKNHYPLTPDLIKKARFLAIASNQTRIRILCFMFINKKACVSDIAEAVNMSVSSISHHLQLMRDNGFFETKRTGNTICYILIADPYIKKLEKIICE